MKIDKKYGKFFKVSCLQLLSNKFKDYIKENIEPAMISTDNYTMQFNINILLQDIYNNNLENKFKKDIKLLNKLLDKYNIDYIEI